MERIPNIPEKKLSQEAHILFNGSPLKLNRTPIDIQRQNTSEVPTSEIIVEKKLAEKISKYFGYQEQSDIDELFITGDITSAFDQEFVIGYPKIEIEIDEYQLTLESQDCLDLCMDFASAITASFRSDFTFLLEEYRKEHPVLTNAIYNYAKENDGFSLPEFKILDAKFADIFLNNINWQGERPGNDHFLLVFQLPKFLANFWWKSEYTSSDKIPSTPHSQVNWGDFYYALMPVVWEEIDAYEYNHGLYLNRINDFGQHEPKNYYYMWIV